MPPTEIRPIPIRPPVTNESWDPEVMRAKAEAGAYPTAKSKRPSRERPGLTEAEAEVAYWQSRCGQPADLAEVEHDAPAAAGHDAEDDARFLALGPRKRQALVRSYLMGALDADQERGAHLCQLAGLDVEQERRAAARQWDAMMRRCQERLVTQPSRRQRAHAGQETITW
jgi:hypothetical protein